MLILTTTIPTFSPKEVGHENFSLNFTAKFATNFTMLNNKFKTTWQLIRIMIEIFEIYKTFYKLLNKNYYAAL